MKREKTYVEFIGVRKNEIILSQKYFGYIRSYDRQYEKCFCACVGYCKVINLCEYRHIYDNKRKRKIMFTIHLLEIFDLQIFIWIYLAIHLTFPPPTNIKNISSSYVNG